MCQYKTSSSDTNHIRPYLVENTGSRPLSQSQAAEGLISSWVGDDQRIPAVVCFFVVVLTYCFWSNTAVSQNMRP